MGVKIVNCDCRQPGYPKHTHTHECDERGQPKVAASVRLSRHERKRSWIWSVLIIILLVLLAWIKRRAPELEVP